MRLLNVKTLQLEEFLGEIPDYAILSHCWAEDEVSLQHLNSGNYRHRKGFEKIASCCRVSEREGYDYAWIDTCCIDKTSSAELSEVINSMFQYYVSSSICYAHLADVYDDDPELPNSSFAKSRWFTRGWTLQELIAPPIVVFLNSSWREIGTRSTLAPAVSAVTRIAINVLRPTLSVPSDRFWIYNIRNRLKLYSIACKLSWAAGRETTRVEDMAYCLLGIFEINMPLLYGEGQKAFVRLQKEIVDESDDMSIFAWEPPEWEVPYLRTGLLAPSPRYFEASHDVQEGGTVEIQKQMLGTFKTSKASIEIKAPIISPGGIHFESPSQLMVHFRSKVLSPRSMYSPLEEKSLPNFMASIQRKQSPDAQPTAQPLSQLSVPQPEMKENFLVAVLNCKTSAARVGILLFSDENGSISRHHSMGLLRLYGNWDQVLKATFHTTLLIPAWQFKRTLEGDSLRAVLLTRPQTSVGELILFPGISGYTCVKAYAGTQVPDPHLDDAFTDTSRLPTGPRGVWKCFLLGHKSSRSSTALPWCLVFYEYESTEEIKVNCFVMDRQPSRMSVTAIREKIEMKSSLNTSEVNILLREGWEVSLKIRQKRNLINLLVLIEKA